MSKPLTSILAFLLVAASLAGADQGRQVNVSALNVRSGPGLGYNIIGVAGGSQRYVAFESNGAWQHIWWAGSSAWIYGGYTSVVGGTGARVDIGTLNVRTGPSTSYSIVSTAHSGQVYYVVGTSGSWDHIWFGGNTRWFYGPYTTNENLGAAPPPPPPPQPAPQGWMANYVGIDKDGSHIPRAGLTNGTLHATLGIWTEPYGSVVSYASHNFVQGRMSEFGGPNDSAGPMALTGLSSLLYDNPTRPSPDYVAQNPWKYYYCAMRWDYSPNGTGWWRSQRLAVINPANGRCCVVAPVDWGPNTYTHRILDLSPYVLQVLGLVTDDNALVAFEQVNTPLGVR